MIITKHILIILSALFVTGCCKKKAAITTVVDNKEIDKKDSSNQAKTAEVETKKEVSTKEVKQEDMSKLRNESVLLASTSDSPGDILVKTVQDTVSDN